MTKVLVTGAGGFLGSHLLPALDGCGHEVVGLDLRRPPDGCRGGAAEYVVGDVTDAETVEKALPGASVVYHLAGCLKATDRRELDRINRGGVEAVCHACARLASPPVVVLVSSMAAAGPAPKGRPQGELAASEHAGRVPITVVRPPIVFGEGDLGCFGMFRAIWRSHVHLVPGYVPKTCSLVHGSDLARLLVLAAERGERLPPAGEVDCEAGRGYYLADCGENPTYGQLGRMIGTALGRERTFVVPFGPIVVWTAAAASDLAARLRRRSTFFSIDKMREAMAGAWWCSGEKAAGQLGFRVTVPLADRLRQTAEWYLREKWLG
jgi:nucleoside-diphosphate-sugar epimerase